MENSFQHMEFISPSNKKPRSVFMPSFVADQRIMFGLSFSHREGKVSYTENGILIEEFDVRIEI